MKCVERGVFIYTFTEVDKNIKNDSLSDFMKKLTFIPHAFGYQCNNPQAVCGERITSDFELICVIGGESRLTIDHNIYTCFTGDTALIPPFTLHKIETPAENPHENYWIHFDIYPFHLQKSFISVLTNNNGYILHPGLGDELACAYRLLKSEIDMCKPGRMHLASSILQLIIIETIRGKDRKTSIETPPLSIHAHEAEIIHKCLDFIHDNIFRSIGVADLVNYLHISESYLYKAFSAVIEMPPNQFIQFVKVKKAEQLLKSTCSSIKEISDMLGFSTPYYFSNVFKKYYKESPRSYKQKLNFMGNNEEQL